MRFRALATDYDGTIATRGRLPPDVRAALVRWREAGRALVLVTGRELGDLGRACPELELFDRVVGENGAVLNRPPTGETVLLSEPVADALVVGLRHRGVVPFGVARAILAAARASAAGIEATARELGVPMSLSFNKSSVMVLPPGVDKASGLYAALAELGARAGETVGFGDAENDLPFLRVCGMSVAVANAVPELREQADRVTSSAEGAGVREVIDELLATDR
jgi:hydroxymethylpyrimidine pyrophosphatase-like HAD family hydrolase